MSQSGRINSGRWPGIVTRAFSMAVLGTAVAAPFDTLVEGLYRPFQGESVALSPDGRSVAYSRHEKDGLCLYVMGIEDGRKIRLLVEEDRPVSFAREKAPARLRYLRWASATRIVFAPTEYSSGVRWQAPIFAVNADGTDARKLADADDFSIIPPPVLNADGIPVTGRGLATIPRRTVIHGLRPTGFRHLQVEALGRPTQPGLSRTQIPTTLFDVDIQTGKITSRGEEFADGRFLHDRTGAVRICYVQPQHSLERHFELKGTGTWSKWTELSTILGDRHFSLTVGNYFGERAYPLGFDGNADVLFFASNVGRNTFGVYGINLATRQRVEFEVEHPDYDLAPLEPVYPGSTLVFDERRQQVVGVRALGLEPLAIWTDAELGAAQRELDAKFPQRAVELLDWTESRDRFLVRVSGGVEPGRFHVYDRGQNLVTEILQRASWLKNADLHEGRTFAFESPAGVRLTGYVTLPRKPRLNPPPLIIDFRAGPLGRETPGFDRESQVLAAMGFVVARINHRGSAGFGLRHRSVAEGGFERMRIDDTLAAIDWIGRNFSIDRRRIATMGTGFGGYFALRALQLAPTTFRCAVAVQTPVDLRRWLEPRMQSVTARRLAPVNFQREAQLALWQRTTSGAVEGSLVETAELLTNPVLLVVDPPRDREIGIQNDALRSRLKRLGRQVEYFEVGAGFELDLPGARARAFRQIHEFLNLRLYDFDVKLGETKEVK